MKIFIPLIVLFLVVSSCNKDYKLEKIDSDVLVSLDEKSSSIVILGETEKIHSYRYHMTYCEKIRKDKIYIEFKKIKVGGTNFAVIGSANCKIELGKLDEGEYDVTFELNKKKTKGKLRVGNSVELTIDSGGNVKAK